MLRLLFSAVSVGGPVLGGLGYGLGVPAMLWAGVALAAVNLLMNVWSGVMRLPLLPGLAMVIGGFVAAPWWYGAALGLLVYTALEAGAELAMARRA